MPLLNAMIEDNKRWRDVLSQELSKPVSERDWAVIEHLYRNLVNGLNFAHYVHQHVLPRKQSEIIEQTLDRLLADVEATGCSLSNHERAVLRSAWPDRLRAVMECSR